MANTPSKWAYVRAAQAKKKVEELRDALRTYGRHQVGCGVYRHEACHCGFAEVCKTQLKLDQEVDLRATTKKGAV